MKPKGNIVYDLFKGVGEALHRIGDNIKANEGKETPSTPPVNQHIVKKAVHCIRMSRCLFGNGAYIQEMDYDLIKKQFLPHWVDWQGGKTVEGNICPGCGQPSLVRLETDEQERVRKTNTSY